jgi:predicted phage terminase large subunit-like protein
MTFKLTDEIKALLASDFHSFAEMAFTAMNPSGPWEDSWHLEAISEFIQALELGVLPTRKLVINLPPRSLKTFIACIAYPAWALGRAPHTKFIVASYSFTLAKQSSALCRDLLQSDFYRSVFPNTILSQTQREKHYWTTTQGGQYYAVSSLGTIAGIGCDTLLLDDPVKPMEAFSPTIRNSTNENIRGTLFSRFNDPRKGKFLLIMQRVHEDDPTGNLMRDGGYTHLKLPAETKTPIDIQLQYPDKPLPLKWHMDANSLLFPQRLTRKILDELRLNMSDLHYQGQYLQEPVPAGGGEFKHHWYQFYRAGSIKPKEMNIVILVDPAGGEELNKKKKKLTDWTALVVVGLANDNNYYLLDIVRDRLNPTERVHMLFYLHRKWLKLSGKPPKVGYEKYGMMTDTHYIKEHQNQEAYHFTLVEVGGQQIKEERIRKLIPDFQQGRWYFPDSLIYVDNEGRRFDLVQELIAEFSSFPKSKFDDMSDALSRIYTEDLALSFPMMKPTMTTKAYMEQPQDDDWLNY